LDDRTVLTGSYNWTLESQEYNYENLLILRDPQRALEYKEEFEALWERAARQA
jgi:phosphatidylserine/phosphatidylglycerophosphate/cardiolipin synthase-like enzyme